MLQLNFVISLENNTKQHRNECRETKLESNKVMYKDAVRYTNPARSHLEHAAFYEDCVVCIVPSFYIHCSLFIEMSPCTHAITASSFMTFV